MRRRFPDGDSIEQDPRGEDPLVYYVPGGDWARAVGLEIEPLYEERRAQSVTSRIWKDHLSRLEAMDDASLTRIIDRLAEVLSREYPGWKTWRTELPSWVLERIGPRIFRGVYEAAGWRSIPGSGETVVEWTR